MGVLLRGLGNVQQGKEVDVGSAPEALRAVPSSRLDRSAGPQGPSSWWGGRGRPGSKDKEQEGGGGQGREADPGFHRLPCGKLWLGGRGQKKESLC